MHRFFVSQLDVVDESQAVICSEDLIHQFTKVLRFVRGEKVILLNNSGFEFLVELGDFSVKKIVGIVLERKFCQTELPVRLVVAQAILKNTERMEWLLQKGTELGVSTFIPLITDRTECRALGKEERLRRILKEAAEQSGRGKIPELLAARKFEKIFSSDAEQENSLDYGESMERIVIVPHPGTERKFSDFCREKLVRGEKKFMGEIVICVGPEGGFTDREVEMVKSSGAHPVSLGSRILRAETVAMVMSTIVAEVFGEM